MSRANHADNLNAVQLFPFVAVLLCTMGSLLVLLVGVARSSKVRAIEEAAAEQAATQAAVAAPEQPVPVDDAATRRELEHIAAYQSELESVRTKAQAQLHHDQLRLRHLEDHMRRLREKLDSLKLAAAELNSLEGEHYDDREQAEREIVRLQQLIEDSRNTIDELRSEAKNRARSYAIVPYQGHRGTRRRPIYIECRHNDVMLQPEGVRFTRDDFQPPIGPGNPLVAALRAAREHIVRYESSSATGKEAEPYPLIIVRPSGVPFYYYVREAIQSWDSEFGYELVEEDWELKFSLADPQLASVEQDAAELARGRLRALAAAAPQAFGAYRSMGGGGDGDGGGNGSDSVSNGGGGGEEYAAESDDFESSLPTSGGGDRIVDLPVSGGQPVAINRGRVEGKPAGGAATDDRYATKPMTSTTFKSPRNSNPSDPESQPLSADGSPAGVSAMAGDDPEQELDDLARDAAANPAEKLRKRTATKARGKNWAIANGSPGMIPIRRTILVVVRDDVLAILPEQAAEEDIAAAGREFRFVDGPTAAYEDLITALESRIKDWGMAGQGLYWRPVVELKIGPNGDRRAGELVRLLKNSGIEIAGRKIAQHDQREDDRANR